MSFGGWMRMGGVTDGRATDGGATGATRPVLAALNQIEAYWTALAAACPDLPVPPRAALDPRGMESALSHAFLIEQIAPGLARLRLGGLELARLMGVEVRGMPLSALFTAGSRVPLAAAVQAVLGTTEAGSARVEMQLSLARGLARAPLSGRMLLLPLRDGHGTITRALGGLQLAEGVPGRGQHRLEITGINLRPLAMPAEQPRITRQPVSDSAAAQALARARAAVEALAAPLPPLPPREPALPLATPAAARVHGLPKLRVIQGGIA